jgi:Tfp pilus assembly protein PilX
MGHRKNSSQGFTLIAALIIMVLLSGVAVGLLFMVTNETRMGGNDLEANLAYYGAESGMEKLTADLSALYSQYMAPTNGQIQNLTNYPPTAAMVGNMTIVPAISYPGGVDANGNPVSNWQTVSAGQNAGLDAEIIPMQLQVLATRPSGATVNITRNVEVALIPVFQFGVFCGYDCSYFAGPNFEFAGRVHTNSSLFLASGGGSNLVFTDKVSAFKQIVMDQLENGFPTNGNYNGTVWLPIASGACPSTVPPAYPPNNPNCKSLPGPGNPPGDASWSGGYPGLQGAANQSFPGISSGTLNGFLINSLTGATNMQLPFVQNSCVSNPPPCTDPIAIIRKAPVGESATSTLGSSRLYNKAQIRVLLADTVADLHPERGAGALDANDVQFVPNAGIARTGLGTEFFGMATKNTNNWVRPFGFPSWNTWPLLGEITSGGIPNGGQGAWLRVEYLNNAGNWIGITQDWLSWGFSRKYDTPPGGAGADPIDPNAILILQQLNSSAGATSIGNSGLFYPINFYDTREGEMRDNANGCAVNGIINAVEINVANLALWLKHAAPYTTANDAGNLVNYTNQNGYILYFSDRRGMLPNPNQGNITSGASGLEDVVNSAQGLTSTTPDSVLEAATYYTYSPEDVDQNGKLDQWGAANIGYGFDIDTSNMNPYQTTTCNTTGAANAVTGARHALRLVAGGMNGGVSYLPVRPDNNQGGFTVASENPVYVLGNYNTGASDPYWTGGTNNTPHAAASIIADSVSVLSNNWKDSISLLNPTTRANRAAASTYYRMAVAAGKNVPFPEPGWTPVANKDFGTDGGMHNFLRLLEDWSNQDLYYNGSLVSMYYAEYNTGTFKCCTTVYNAPRRNFYFDTLFLNPADLPPGTPMFQDVVNLSYHQNFTPQ